MSITRKIACLSVVTALLSACGTDGYYDNRGHYQYDGARESNNNTNNTFTNNDGNPSHAGNNYYTDRSARKGDSSGVIGYDRERDSSVRARPAGHDSDYTFERTGYYDYQGKY